MNRRTLLEISVTSTLSGCISSFSGGSDCAHKNQGEISADEVQLSEEEKANIVPIESEELSEEELRFAEEVIADENYIECEPLSEEFQSFKEMEINNREEQLENANNSRNYLEYIYLRHGETIYQLSIRVADVHYG